MRGGQANFANFAIFTNFADFVNFANFTNYAVFANLADLLISTFLVGRGEAGEGK